MAEYPIEERVATLENQVKEIAKQESKIDKIMEAVNEIKLSLSDNFTKKADCKIRCDICDTKFSKVEERQKYMTRTLIGATVALVVFLIQQVFNITVKLGG